MLRSYIYICHNTHKNIKIGCLFITWYYQTTVPLISGRTIAAVCFIFTIKPISKELKHDCIRKGKKCKWKSNHRYHTCNDYFYENVIEWDWNIPLVPKYVLQNQSVWNNSKDFVKRKKLKNWRSSWSWFFSTFQQKKYKLPIEMKELYIFLKIKQ